MLTNEELWKEQDQTWYTKAVSYWDNQEQSYNGVLGGYGFVSDIDVRDSRQLLEKTMKSHFQEQASGGQWLVAIDCGAGVGRVANELLLHLFAEVDLLEPSKPLLDCARKNLEGKVSTKHPSGHQAVNFYLAGLEGHSWSPDRPYDCIWIQWCLLYLTDADFLVMFEKAKAALKLGGLIFVKENICKEGFIVDKEDSSLTRSNAYMLDLFEKANLTLLQSVKQKNFPKELFDVRLYCLKPK